jgi:hypothetical protein
VAQRDIAEALRGALKGNGAVRLSVLFRCCLRAVRLVWVVLIEAIGGG